MASLAFLALACQFLFSFGHVHLDRFIGKSSNWAISAVGKAVATPAGGGTADLPISPRQKNPSGLGDDFCAICASISLVGALVVPIAPALVAQNPCFEDLHRSFAVTRARPIDYFRFNARGPPAV